MEEDLRLCTVKPAYETERRFCFEGVLQVHIHIKILHNYENEVTYIKNA
jgi:hypothetical protein